VSFAQPGVQGREDLPVGKLRAQPSCTVPRHCTGFGSIHHTSTTASLQRWTPSWSCMTRGTDSISRRSRRRTWFST